MSRRTPLEGSQIEGSQNRWSSTIAQVLCSQIMWLSLVVVLAMTTLIVGTRWASQAGAPVPADLFMQSVVKRDGALGWHQLCPALQAEVPLAMISDQAKTQLLSESRKGMRLTVDYVGAHSRPQGGQLRFYVVTAHRPGGWVEMRTYVVSTQGSGCVEDVQNL